MVVAIALLAVYLWPTFTRSADRVDVAVVGNGAVVTAADEIARHLRERGLAVAVVTQIDPCAPDAIEAATSGARAVVASFVGATYDACRDAIFDGFSRLDRVIVVAQDADVIPGSVDATWLVPPLAGARLGCQWWEPFAPAAAIANCEGDGLITVRDELGELTEAGRDRFARVVAGAVP